MNPNHTEDPENPLLSSVTNGNAQKRVGRSFKQFDLRHLRQVGTENLPKEVRIASEFIRKASGGKVSSKSGKKSVDCTANRTEVILTSIKGSLADLTFGNAVRAGNEIEVSRLLSENGLELLLAEVSFDIVLDIDTRLTPPIIRRNTTFQNAVVESNNDCLSKHGFMTVTPFQLGLLAQHRHIIKLLIEKILETNDNETQLQWLKKVLGTKTSLKIPDDAVPCDKGTLSLDGMNAFHLATKYQPKALKDILYILNEKKLMSSLSYLLEERDWRLKQTPLHIAAKCPTAEVARLLLDNGADVDAQDYQRFTPLHIASKAGNEDICSLLLERDATPHIKGHRGKTPLHKAKHPKIVQLLVKSEADPYAKMADKFDPYGLGTLSCFDTYIERNSDCSKILLDESISTNGQDLDSSDLLVVYDLDIFRHESKRPKEDEEDDEIRALSKLVSLKLYNLLEHPLSEVMLHLKWQSIKKLYWVKFWQYALFVIALTALAYMQSDLLRRYDAKLDVVGKVAKHGSIQQVCLNNTSHPSCYFQPIFHDAETWRMVFFYLFYIFVAVNTIFLMVREALECYYCWTHYGSKEDCIEIGLIFVTSAYLIAIFTSPREVNLHLSVWSVFLAWIEMNLLLGRFPSIGIYVHMFTNVFNKLLLFILVYSPVLIAFSFAFNLLLPYKQAFDSPLLKILAMMIGEFEYSTFLFFEEDTFQQDSNAYITTQLIFLLFVMFVSIVIGNLLVALTVSEIGLLTKEGEVIGLEKMALQIVALEDIFINKPTITDCLPPCLKLPIEKLLKRKTRVFERLKRTGGKDDEPTKICVRPFEPSRWKTYKRERSIRTWYRLWSILKSLIYPSDREDSLGDDSGNALYAEYNVYLYHENKMVLSEPTDFRVPKSSVKRALKLLKDREENEKKRVVSKAIEEEQESPLHQVPQNHSKVLKSTVDGTIMTQAEMMNVIDDMMNVLQQMKQSLESSTR